jgi:hypothetical protein
MIDSLSQDKFILMIFEILMVVYENLDFLLYVSLHFCSELQNTANLEGRN